MIFFDRIIDQFLRFFLTVKYKAINVSVFLLVLAIYRKMVPEKISALRADFFVEQFLPLVAF